MIDIHCHVVPGVDDGAKDEGMTREMLRRAKDAGVRALIATPHVYRPEHHGVNLEAAPIARGIARETGISFGVGCEFNYRALIRSRDGVPSLYDQMRTDAGVLLPYCLAGTHCLLLEMSNEDPFPDWEIVITELVENGYQPIIAHPERYIYVQKDIAFAEEMIDYGCELQLDAGGLMAGMFSAERRIARKMLSQGMVSYIASDAHRPQHYDTYEKVYKTFRDEWPQDNQLSAQLGLRRR